MPLKHLKPVTPSCRGTVLLTFERKKNEPIKSKTKGFRKSVSGRNNSGKITMYHRGGRHKRSYRKVNFSSFINLCIVENFEYDPSRSSLLARVFCIFKKTHFYVLATQNLKIGQVIRPENFKELKLGNRCFLKDIPIGTTVHSLGSKLRPQRAVFQRAAGTYAQVIHKNNKFCTVKLSSGKTKELFLNTSATIGSVSNSDHRYRNLGKAGRSRWLGIRPTVRGVAMNPIDHPHGGGEGKSSGGRPSVTPWSRPAFGRKTRKLK